MPWKEFATDYLTFTRRDRIGILVLTFIILAVFFLPTTLSKIRSRKSFAPDTSWIASMKKLEQKEMDNDRLNSSNKENNNYPYFQDRSSRNQDSKPKGTLFFFDPNTLSSEGWEKLGLRKKTIQIIQNYLGKGGQFRKPDDLKRIYGLLPDEYERIAPYIKMESPEKSSGYKTFTNEVPMNKQFSKPAAPRYAVIDINTADTTALIALPGIGSKLAVRIITFRDKLGGFFSISQVGETFGLPDSAFQKIKQFLKIENTTVRKININEASVDELKAHPYIRYRLATPIVAYRNEHGSFTKAEELKKVMAVTDEDLHKLAPYLSF
ncbi:MAG: helix-hairpin-helix domain-containing protein [Chitinophagaceae bacterium]